ncbi:MAG TPA: ABC-type transport auxiliary lipoprotein family protein [Candidatus Hydrogenedens sp.]|nr:PqiC family protein [Candidatus Hydrogenedens sp.]HOK09525.1 ABC-type transport auxiliary lipoprotein family protein [Candidatus Hydrogenedens sp.]
MKYITCIISTIFIFLIGNICIGCISAPPLHYYTLEWSLKHQQDTSQPLWLQVASIKLAEPLKRKEIMIRKSPVEIEYYSTHLWASSLEELLTHKINQSFMCENLSKNTPDVYLHIDVLNFEVVEMSPQINVDVKFVVQFLNPENMKLITQKVYAVEKQPADKDVKEVVKTLSLCVDEIIDNIYKDATHLNKT